MIEILPNWHPILAFRIPYGCTLYSNEQKYIAEVKDTTQWDS